MLNGCVSRSITFRTGCGVPAIMTALAPDRRRLDRQRGRHQHVAAVEGGIDFGADHLAPRRARR